MPSHDAQRASAERAGDPDALAGSPGRRMSRRSVLQGVATAGAVGLAATTLGAAVSPAAAAEADASQSSPRAGGAAKAASGPLVVHVRDARSGDIEVFSGTSQARLRDKDLAARIARAIG
jgi:uncharacterized membrane protein